jgi:hypothetical protein
VTHVLKLQAMPAKRVISAAQLQAARLFKLDALRHPIPHYALKDVRQVGNYTCLGCAEEHRVERQGLSLKPHNLGLLPPQTRQQGLETLLHPGCKAAAEAELGGYFEVHALFMQAYEANVVGPGGVIGWRLPGEKSQVSASHALLFWQWRNEASYQPPKPEAEAAELLWGVIQQETANALRWLSVMPVGEHRISQGLRNEVHPLLGTPAWQCLLAERGGVRAALTSLNTLEILA